MNDFLASEVRFDLHKSMKSEGRLDALIVGSNFILGCKVAVELYNSKLQASLDAHSVTPFSIWLSK